MIIYITCESNRLFSQGVNLQFKMIKDILKADRNIIFSLISFPSFSTLKSIFRVPSGYTGGKIEIKKRKNVQRIFLFASSCISVIDEAEITGEREK